MSENNSRKKKISYEKEVLYNALYICFIDLSMAVYS